MGSAQYRAFARILHVQCFVVVCDHAFAYSDDVRFDGVPWLPRPGHAPSSSAVPNGDEKRTTTASSCIAFTAKFGSEAYTDDARDERADDRSGVRLMRSSHACAPAVWRAERHVILRRENKTATRTVSLEKKRGKTSRERTPSV